MDAFIGFRDEEIRNIKKGEIYEETVVGDEPESTRSATERGGSGMSTKESIEHILKQLRSDNTYTNPITGQEFKVKLVSDNKALQERLQEQMEVAARVEKATAASAAEEMSVDGNNADGIENDETLYVLEEVGGDDAGDLAVSDVRIELDVLDTAGVEPPYQVQFLLLPEGSTDKGTERGTLEPMIATGSVTIRTPLCKQINIRVKGTNLDGSKAGAVLSWSGGRDPRRIDPNVERLRPVRQGRVSTLRGRSRQKEQFELSVKTGGSARYSIEGNYE